MTDTYKVRMTVLALIPTQDSREAHQSALDMAAESGLTVLHVEEPELVNPQPYPYGSAEEDLYP